MAGAHWRPLPSAVLTIALMRIKCDQQIISVLAES